MNREVFFSCDLILTAVSEIFILVFKQDHVMQAFYQLFLVSNDIVIQSKDFTTRKTKKREGDWLLFQSITPRNRTVSDSIKGKQQRHAGNKGDLPLLLRPDPCIPAFQGGYR